MRLCLLLICLGACYNPTFPTGKYTCKQTSDCPGGLTCDDGLCGTADLREAVHDLREAVQDLRAVVDMAQPRPYDAAQQQTTACTGGKGTLVGKAGQDVWACPGMFDSQMAQNMLCGPGYAVCTTGVNVDENTCNHAGGYFLLDYSLSADPQGLGVSFKCGSDSGQFKELLGCGSAAAFNVSSPCVGLTGGTTCQGMFFTISGWSCTTNFADAKNTNATDGVLCCHM